jgi:hypothetical protein
MDHRVASIFAAIAVLSGCSGGGAPASSASTGAGGAASSAGSVTSVVAGTGGGMGVGGGVGGGGFAGGVGPCGGESFGDAQPINVNATLMGELLPSYTPNYYAFTGQKGEILDIEVHAQLLDAQNPAPFDPTYIDTVVSLYDATQNKIAENDDTPEGGSNDSDLFTVLPADGTYCLRVEDCWAWAPESGKTCALPKIKPHSNYDLQIYAKTSALGNVVVEPIPDPGNGPTSAIPLKYEQSPDGSYYRTDVIGYFDDATDVDFYSFQIPANVPVNPGYRLTATFLALAAGSSQDGSTEPIGPVTIEDMTGATVLAQVDGALGGENPAVGGEIHMPASAGTPYLLVVGRNDTNVGSHDFYVLFNEVGGSNPVETGGNNTMATAETLMPVPGPNGDFDAYIEGNLAAAPGEQDWFRVPVPPALPSTATVLLSCAAQSYGSGLRGLKATMYHDDGQPQDFLGSAIEPMSGPLMINPVAVPQNASAIVFSVMADEQDPTVTGTYYECGLHFQDQ